MNHYLTPSQVAQFEQNGCLFPLPILTPEEVNRYHSAITRLETSLGDSTPKHFFGQTHLHFPEFYELATHPRIMEVAADILGPNLLIHSTTIFHKEPGKNTYASWHQDGYFMDLSSPEFLTCWVAMTDSTPENGCVKVIPGTHKLQKLPHGSTSISKKNLLGSGLEIVGDIDTDAAVDVTLTPGDMSLHHVYAVHGSEPNNSDKHRLGYVVKIIPTHVSQSYPHFPVVMARGEDAYGHWSHLPAPPTGDFQNCLTKHMAFVEDLRKKREEVGRKTG